MSVRVYVMKKKLLVFAACTTLMTPQVTEAPIPGTYPATAAGSATVLSPGISLAGVVIITMVFNFAWTAPLVYYSFQSLRFMWSEKGTKANDKKVAADKKTTGYKSTKAKQKAQFQKEKRNTLRTLTALQALSVLSVGMIWLACFHMPCFPLATTAFIESIIDGARITMLQQGKNEIKQNKPVSLLPFIATSYLAVDALCDLIKMPIIAYHLLDVMKRTIR